MMMVAIRTTGGMILCGKKSNVVEALDGFTICGAILARYWKGISVMLEIRPRPLRFKRG
jgi:hypothetical protein